MMIFRRKLFFLILLVGVLIPLSKTFVYAQTTDDCQNMPAGQDKVNCYQRKVNDLQSQENTLSSQIAVMDNQIALTEARISANEKQISNLVLDIDTADKKIDGLQQSLDSMSEVLINRIKNTYEVGTIQPVAILLSSGDASNFLTRLNYLKIAQAHDRKLILETTAAKNDYANQKNILEDKKKQIEALKKQQEDYSAQLDQEKQSKKVLLSQTQGNEATYQSLLSQAKAQLAALAGFAKSASGGVSIIPHQDLSDGWGRYYNQRDANWGNNLIGLSSETISSVGCLLTSYSMVVTHYGGSLTPADVASNASNFSVGTAMFNAPGPSANGHSASYVTNPSMQTLRDALNSEKSVIVGLSADGGPFPQHYSDHWVVLRSVDGESFRINDPEYAGAMNVPLNDHYGSWTIIEARIYN